MLTGIDKALQDWIVSTMAIGTYIGWDFSKWENVAVTVFAPLGKAFLTWLVPNKG